MPYIGDKSRINASSSIFADFIEKNCLYVDKTKFIEHVFQDISDVLLFTRPRRMGKSLNLNTLHTFLDCKKDTRHLFKGLYIESTPAFDEINKYPVIYFSFKDYRFDSFKKMLRQDMEDVIEKYLNSDQMGKRLTQYCNDDNNYDPYILKQVTRILFEVYGKKPFILIDEYDKPILDNMNHAEFSELKEYIVTLLSSSMKDNPYLGKAILTGVTRIANESLFSAFNNPRIYDVFRASKYDADFSLTEAEVTELLNEEESELIRPWYNNMRVGNSLLYNIYSVMLYIDSKDLRTHWARTGSSDMLGKLMTKQQSEIIAKALATDSAFTANVDDHISITALQTYPCPDQAFYSLAVQAGYLTFEILRQTQELLCNISIPNQEARYIWTSLLQYPGNSAAINELRDIFNNIADTAVFDRELEKLIMNLFSFYDAGKETENAYHMFFLGMMKAFGIDCKTNREDGLCRPDIVAETLSDVIIIEFKAVDTEKKQTLESQLEKALEQIDERKYWHAYLGKGKPIYKTGISCLGKQCLIKTVLHEQ